MLGIADENENFPKYDENGHIRSCTCNVIFQLISKSSLTIPVSAVGEIKLKNITFSVCNDANNC